MTDRDCNWKPNIIMKKIATILLTILSLTALAQNLNSERDSLYILLKQAKTPAEQFRCWNNLSAYFLYAGQADSLIKSTEQEFKLAAMLQEDTLLVESYI